MNRTLKKGMESLPKVIGPRGHAVIDYIAAGTFLVAAAILWKRNRRAAIGAAMNGKAILGLSMITDYPGGKKKWISFRTHGKIDRALPLFTAITPRLLGFRHDLSAGLFQAQAIAEAMTVQMTDFEMPERRRRGLLRRVA